MAKPPNTGVTKFVLDLAALSAPNLRVFANGCSILDHGLVLEFAFTQARPKGPARLAASLMISAEAAFSRLLQQSRDFYRMEGVKLREAGIPVSEVERTAPEWNGAPIVQCNLFRASRSGTEASMECYWLSPWGAFLAGQGKKPPTPEPVIAIQLPFPLFMGILEHVSRMAPELRKRVGSLMPFQESPSLEESSE